MNIKDLDQLIKDFDLGEFVTAENAKGSQRHEAAAAAMPRTLVSDGIAIKMLIGAGALIALLALFNWINSVGVEVPAMPQMSSAPEPQPTVSAYQALPVAEKLIYWQQKYGHGGPNVGCLPGNEHLQCLYVFGAAPNTVTMALPDSWKDMSRDEQYVWQVALYERVDSVGAN